MVRNGVLWCARGLRMRAGHGERGAGCTAGTATLDVVHSEDDVQRLWRGRP